MIQGQEKRRHLRYQILDFASVFMPGESEPVNSLVVDIGLGGLQLRSKHTLPPMAKCVLRIGRLGSDPFEIKAEVRHVAAIGDSGLFALGMKFIPETHAERVAIAEFVHEVFQRQSEQQIV